MFSSGISRAHCGANPRVIAMVVHQLFSKMSRLRRLRHSLLIGIVSLFFSQPIQAIIIGSVADHGDGRFKYSYTIDNSAGTFDVFAFSLEFALTENQIDWNPLDVFSGGEVEVPTADWIASLGIPTTGASAQDFISLSFVSDVLVGQSLSGFSFVSSFAPTLATFTVEFGSLGESATGLTIGPGAPPAGVPESIETLTGLLVGLSGLYVLRRTRQVAA